MPNQPMKLSVDEIKEAMLNPELITHLHGFKASNQWGDIDGRQLLIDIYRLCIKHEQLTAKTEDN